MEGCSYNFLTDALIRVERRSGEPEKLTLPEVFANLANESDIGSFSALQPHQWPAWYAFLVQLAALALLEDPNGWRGLNEEGWRAKLRALAPDHAQDEPWCLVVSNLAKPAFLQPPVPEGKLDGFDGPYTFPDTAILDVLVTATNHDLKIERQMRPAADHWLFSLMTLQTFSGYLGKNIYGVIRMNGGFGSRPIVGLAPGREWGVRFRRDLAVLLDKHDELLERHGRPREGARNLLWLEPWDGKATLQLSDCDPYMIEVARRVRLSTAGEEIVAYRKPSSSPRLSPKADKLKGNVGDPWIPVNTEGAALNIGSAGLTYDRMRRLMFADGYTWSTCQTPQPNDPEEVYLYGAALARGQGKTEGFHERWVRIPKERRYFLFDQKRRDVLNTQARDRVEVAGNVQRRALHPALVTFLSGAPERLDLRDSRDQQWLNRFDMRVDQLFFPQLWEDAELETEEQERRWSNTLRGLAEEILQEAEREMPVADARRERAVARAWMVLWGGLRKHIPEAFEEKEETRDAEV